MKVLVTGAAGFIGSNFIHYLRRERPYWDIAALDLLTYAGNLENISRLIEKKTVRFFRVDITDAGAVNSLFETERFNLVFNFAAESHVDRSIASAAEFVRTNVVGTQILLDAALRSGVERYIQVSTDEVYGSLGPTGSFVETTPLDPTSPYAASKAAADLLVQSFHKTHKVNTVITRCTNNYGPYQFPEKLIPLFVTNALNDLPLPLYGDGMNVRSWLYVADHCEALLLTAEKGRAGEVYNIGGSPESEIPNIEVTKMILDHLGKGRELIKRVADRPAHDRRYSIDHTKIKNELGWEPGTPFREGLMFTIDWYLKNSEWWKRIKSGEYLEYYERLYGDRLKEAAGMYS